MRAAARWLGDPDGDREAVLPEDEGIAPLPTVDARGYAGDPRFERLARDWDERVAHALDRVPLLTGLHFAEGPPPRVALTKLEDERIPFELRTDVVDGRRRVAVHVNAEPILAGMLDVDRTILHALGTAVLQDALGRRQHAPAWVIEMAGILASGTMRERIDRIARKWTLGSIEAIRVEPKNPKTAESTAVAALLLIGRRGSPADVRRFLGFVADGDDAFESMGRLVGEPGTGWIEVARVFLHGEVKAGDDTPWTLLERTERAAQEMGRTGLVASIPKDPPREIADELVVLEAQMALDEGDRKGALALLRSLPPDAASRLRDPASALALRIDAEQGPGGDVAEARRLIRRLELDHPKSAAWAALRAKHPSLGLEEDPVRWMALMRERIRQEGNGFLDVQTSERYGRVLLQDHRARAAEDFLFALGRRALAIELQSLARAIEDAQAEPTPAALARAETRLERWIDDPTKGHRQDVVDCGLAAAEVIASLSITQPDAPDRARTAILTLLVDSAGAERAMPFLERVWREHPEPMLRDVRALAPALGLDVLDAAIRGGRLQAIARRDDAALREAAAYGLPWRWLEAHPRFLEILGSPSFDERSRAVDVLVRDVDLSVPPDLVARLLTDTSPVIRRRAVELAIAQRHEALVESALRDEDTNVQVVALRGMGTLRLPAARYEAMQALDDAAMELRRAAAQTLLTVAPDDEDALRALAARLVDEDARVREPLGMALSRAVPGPLGRALVAVIDEVRGRQPLRRDALFRLFTVFERASGQRVGMHPGATPEAIRTMRDTVARWTHRTTASELSTPRPAPTDDLGTPPR